MPINFTFKFKTVKSILLKYMDIHEFSFHVGPNSIFDISIDDKILTITVDQLKSKSFIISDELDDFISDLYNLNKKYIIAEVANFLTNGKIYISDSANTKVFISKGTVFKNNVIFIGSYGYVYSVVVSNGLNQFIDDVVIGLNKYEENVEFPVLEDVIISVPENTYNSLPPVLRDQPFIKEYVLIDKSEIFPQITL